MYDFLVLHYRPFPSLSQHSINTQKLQNFVCLRKVSQVRSFMESNINLVAELPFKFFYKVLVNLIVRSYGAYYNSLGSQVTQRKRLLNQQLFFIFGQDEALVVMSYHDHRRNFCDFKGLSKKGS